MVQRMSYFMRTPRFYHIFTIARKNLFLYRAGGRLVLSMYFRLYFQVYFRVYFRSVRQPFFQNTVKKRFIDRTMLKLNCIFILLNHCSTVGLQANFADLNSHKARTSNFYVGGRVPNIYLLTKQQVHAGFQPNIQ